MNKKDVIEFFNLLADSWDENQTRSDEIINKILDNAELSKGKSESKSVLDVACGTGFLIPDYKDRGIKDIIAIDISPKMIEIARNKFPDINFICGDVEDTKFNKKFDAIVVYNAFPHFPDGKELIKNLSELLNEGGTLTIAHGLSREKLSKHHSGSAKHVSNGLMSASDLSEIFQFYNLKVTTKIDDEIMYQVVGKR